MALRRTTCCSGWRFGIDVLVILAACFAAARLDIFQRRRVTLELAIRPSPAHRLPPVVLRSHVYLG